MRLVVRLATEQDAETAVALDPSAAHDAHRRDWLRQAFTGQHERVARLAFADDAPAGLAVVGEFFGHPFLELVLTAAAFQRRGVASALMADIEQAHIDQRLFVSTNESNTPMRDLLVARGYTPAGQVDHLDPGDPELFFVRLPAR